MILFFRLTQFLPAIQKKHFFEGLVLPPWTVCGPKLVFSVFLVILHILAKSVYFCGSSIFPQEGWSGSTASSVSRCAQTAKISGSVPNKSWCLRRLGAKLFEPWRIECYASELPPKWQKIVFVAGNILSVHQLWQNVLRICKNHQPLYFASKYAKKHGKNRTFCDYRLSKLRMSWFFFSDSRNFYLRFQRSTYFEG